MAIKSSDVTKVICTPVGRNTAPAIAQACLKLNYDDLVLVTTSDHLIKDSLSYENSVSEAKKLAKEGALVTFGIQPSYAETGFGYMEVKGDEVLSFNRIA